MIVAVSINQHNVSSNAPNSQFAENDGFIYPVQPRSTYTNLGYALTSGIALGLFETKLMVFTFPYLLVAVWAECVAITSALFHASAGYGETANLDVSCILPFVLCILWQEIWTLLLMYKSYKYRLSHRNTYFNFVDCRSPPFGNWWWVPNCFVFLLSGLLFYLEFTKQVNFPWDTKLDIFVASILSMVALGIIIVMWSVSKGYLRRGHLTLSIENHLIGVFLTVFLIGIFITLSFYSKQWEHGLRAHLATSTAISLIIVYNKAVFTEVYNV